jgi:hypothetical protein
MRLEDAILSAEAFFHLLIRQQIQTHFSLCVIMSFWETALEQGQVLSMNALIYRWHAAIEKTRPASAHICIAQTGSYPAFAHPSSSGDLKKSPDMASNK